MQGMMWIGTMTFLFSPLFGEDFPFDEYFSDALKPPTRWDLKNSDAFESFRKL